MRRDLSFRVLLPENYDGQSGKYPVLYLLHGLFGSGDNWLELTGLEHYIFDKKFAVVLPDGIDKWYTDSATNTLDRYETFFLNEFIPAIEEDFRIGGSRGRRAVAGLSMGGYGAIKFALKRPDLFVFAASLSGAFNAPQLTESGDSAEFEELLPSITEVFGAAQSPTRSANDLFQRMRQMSPEEVESLPFLYFDCGREDMFLGTNKALSALLAKKNAAFVFEETAGGHDWDYWDRQLRAVIEITDKIFR